MLAIRNSFQVCRNWKITTVAIPGRASGQHDPAKMVNSLAPSTRAASTSSSGSVSKNARIRNIENGAEPLM